MQARGDVEPGPGTRLPLGAWVLAGLVVVVQFVTGWRYGLFRDEFYYLACAEHLDWGYVDHPPLSVAVLAAVRALLGDSLPALRLVPALLGATLVLLGARLARELGGGRFAQVMAALAVAFAPQFLAQGSYYSMNSFDLVFWALGALLLARLARTDDDRLWLAMGALLGLGLLNKISVLFFGTGLAVAVVLTPLRGHLRRPRLWLGALIGAALFAPHVIWQVRHDWPTLEFIHNASRFKNVALSPWQFAVSQVPEIHPLNLLLWLPGLAWLLASREGRRFRALGIVYVVAFTILALQHSKPYYLGPAYPMLLAAGAVAFERATAVRLGWLRPAFASVLALTGVLIAPMALPVLPVETFVAYQRALGATPSPSEKQALGPLPQFFADRFGWREMTDAVVSAYRSLTPEEQRNVLIVASNYGEAGAVTYYGRRLGLPRVVSQHNNYFLWGPGDGRARLVITVGMPADALCEVFESVTPAASFSSPWAMPYEMRHPVHVCRGLKLPLDQAWQRGKHFI